MEYWNTLEEVRSAAWGLLARASHSRNDPMRTPALATQTEIGPDVRTLVMRTFKQTTREVLFYTDARSPKVAVLKRYERAHLLYWHPGRKVQLRLRVKFECLQGDAICRSHWEKIGVRGRKAYAAIHPPGTPLEAPGDNLPSFWKDDMELEKTECAFGNFMILKGIISEMDVLHLSSKGHQRAVFAWEGEVPVKAAWVTP